MAKKSWIDLDPRLRQVILVNAAGVVPIVYLKRGRRVI